jgi:hypothetical protein
MAATRRIHINILRYPLVGEWFTDVLDFKRRKTGNYAMTTYQKHGFIVSILK